MKPGVNPGSPDKLNTVSGINTILTISEDEIRDITRPIQSGVPFYNTTTREFKISDGATVPKNVLDHQHPFTHAPLVHSHIQGVNEPWLMSNPRLWYANDLVNHPELIPLDGSEIEEDRAQFLSLVYPGTKVLTEAVSVVEADGSWSNDDINAKVSSSQGFRNVSKLFGELIDIHNFASNEDQWYTGSTDVDSSATVTITFKHGHAYLPTQYVIMPCAGTPEAPFLRHPTPKHWVLEGSELGDGSDWEIVDEHDNEPDTNWNPCMGRVFDLTETSLTKNFKAIRLRIISWNASEFPDQQTGLRRFFLLGKRAGTFNMPNVPSPDPDFVWVVPMKNLNVGLIRENVGDIGYTSVLKSLIPTYRLPTDGRLLDKKHTDNELLFSVIGHQYDHEVRINSFATSHGSIDGEGNWISGISDESEPSWISFDVTTENVMIGGYKLYCDGTRTPRTWTVEGVTADGETRILQNHLDVSEEEFRNVFGTFFIENVTSPDHLLNDDGTVHEIPVTPVDDTVITSVKITVLEWNDGSDPIGFSMVEAYGHPLGKFYIPHIEGQHGEVPYIVRNLNATDVSPEIIARLQMNISQLAKAQALLANRVDELDTNIDTTGA